MVTDTGKVRLIDLEYSGPNYAAFDIANLFNEYIILITMTMMTIMMMMIMMMTISSTLNI